MLATFVFMQKYANNYNLLVEKRGLFLRYMFIHCVCSKDTFSHCVSHFSDDLICGDSSRKSV